MRSDDPSIEALDDIVRFLTAILQPDEDSATRWHLMTAWDPSTRQTETFHKHA